VLDPNLKFFVWQGGELLPFCRLRLGDAHIPEGWRCGFGRRPHQGKRLKTAGNRICPPLPALARTGSARASIAVRSKRLAHAAEISRCCTPGHGRDRSRPREQRGSQ
jgi:hypothetical protein